MVQCPHPRKGTNKRFSYLSITALLLGLTTLFHTVSAQEWVYTVRPGDSLWKISNEYLISPEYWPKVQELNGVEKTLQLKPGTRLKIPLEWLKQQPATASIISFRGNIELIRQGETAPLPADHILRRGDGIRTGRNSSISIEFSDGSTVLVLPKSEIYLEVLEAQEDKGLTNTTIKVIDGRVENKVIRQRNGSRYQINTPAAVAAVRGTEFRVGYEHNGKTMRSEVLAGAVGVTGSGVTQNVRAGYATLAKAGSPPIAPRQLPVAPELGGLGKLTADHSITFQWPALADVSNYRAQLALDDGFSQLVGDALLDVPQVTWTDLAPASYFMRVRGIDELGLEGFNAVHSFAVSEPLQAPRALTPRDGIVLKTNQPFIAWSSIAAANFYHLQLASDPDFSDNLVEITSLINNNFRPADGLAPGQYYWRVQSTSQHGDESGFSEPRRFIIGSANE